MELSLDERIGRICYTNRDLIIYAFGIGCTIEEGSESRYIYEHDAKFAAFPLFPLTLAFRAMAVSGSSNDQMFDLPTFPPLMMKGPFVAPSFSSRHRKRGGAVIHLSQKYRLHKLIPVTTIIPGANDAGPIQVDITTNVLSVLPKKRGTIVVTETSYYISSKKGGDGHSKKLLASSQAATLYPVVLDGRPQTINDSHQKNNQLSNLNPPVGISQKITKSPSARKTYAIGNNQALLYRLSGDTNRIHVEGSPLFHSTQPILHGLCTLGYAVRALQSLSGQEFGTNGAVTIECQYVECRFTKPVFVGDEIEVCMWWDSEWGEDINVPRSRSIQGRMHTNEYVRLVLFQVRKIKDDTIVLDGGISELRITSAGAASSSGVTTSVPIPSKL